jgi:hypothetical protein
LDDLRSLLITLFDDEGGALQCKARDAAIAAAQGLRKIIQIFQAHRYHPARNFDLALLSIR